MPKIPGAGGAGTFLVGLGIAGIGIFGSASNLQQVVPLSSGAAVAIGGGVMAVGLGMMLVE